MFRTDDKAKLTFTNISGLKIMLDGKDFTWDEFCQKINSGQWEFECIDEKYESSQCLYEGWVWFDREPYHQELLMSFSYGDAVYQWDTIREDRPW
jgi:hypothetical protein